MDAQVRTLGPLERALHLKSVDALGGLPPAELGVVARHARERRFRAGSAVFRPGQRPASFHVVVAGGVRVTGAEHDAARIGPEECLGLLALLARWDEGLDAVAEEDTTTLELDVEDLHDVLEDHFAVYLHELRGVARRMMATLAALPDGTHIGATAPLLPVSAELDVIQRLLFLRRTAAFQRANMDALVEMARHATVVRFAPGERLWTRGDPSGFNCLVMAGTVRGVHGAPERSFVAGPGVPLGTPEALCGAPRWYDAVAVEPVLALRSEVDLFLDLLEDHFAMALDYLAATATVLIQQLRGGGWQPPP